MQRFSECMAAFLLLAGATPLPAQKGGEPRVPPEVTRDVFTYTLSSTITVDVATDASGALRLMRGRAGQIEVTARALGGIARAGLAGDEASELTLTTVGADEVDYLVIVPEDLRVNIKLPDRHASEVFGTLQDVGTYVWEAARPRNRRSKSSPSCRR